VWRYSEESERVILDAVCVWSTPEAYFLRIGGTDSTLRLCQLSRSICPSCRYGARRIAKISAAGRDDVV
jgi:hypothetical protein